MSRILFLFVLVLIATSCKKEKENVLTANDAIISYFTEANCGFLLWIDDKTYKMENENIIADSCKNRYYTKVDVKYQLLNQTTAITCPMFAIGTTAKLVRVVRIVGKQ